MDYAHARHAGNFGDVFKHVALIAVLEALREDASPLSYVESHAGDGLYQLGSNGEWTAGAQKLWPARGAKVGDADVLDRYVSLVTRWSRPGAEKPEKYPGSPLVAQALLRPQDRLVLYDIEPNVTRVLRTSLGDEARAEVRLGDGLASLPAAVEGEKGRRVLALVDPPYTQRAEWDATAQAVCAARSAAPKAAFLIWYPIKALTRPRALLKMLTDGGVHGTVVELISVPLRLKRDKLSGSGVVLVNAPERATATLLASLVRLGPALMTQGEWSANQIGF
jgi:23S rRNA (adenine2030-N6)-methyltransferase